MGLSPSELCLKNSLGPLVILSEASNGERSPEAQRARSQRRAIPKRSAASEESATSDPKKKRSERGVSDERSQKGSRTASRVLAQRSAPARAMPAPVSTVRGALH